MIVLKYGTVRLCTCSSGMSSPIRILKNTEEKSQLYLNMLYIVIHVCATSKQTANKIKAAQLTFILYT